MTRVARLGAMLVLALAAALEGCADRGSLEEMRALHEERRYFESIAPLRAMLDRDPDQPEVNLLLGVALMRTDSSSNAIWPLRRAMESPEHVVEAGLLLARAELSSRTPRDVLAAVDRVLAVEPKNTEALAIRAQALLEAKREEEALEAIEQVVEIDPDDLRILVPRVLALIRLERIDAAEQALAIAKEQLETTDQAVSPSVRSRLCVANGLFAFEKGEPKRATERYQGCLEAYPSDPLVVSEAVEHFDRVNEPERATALLRAAMEVSDAPYFRNALAGRVGRQGDREEEERLLRAGAEQQGTPQAWFALGDYYVVRDRLDEALAAFERAMEAEREPGPMTRFAYVDTLIHAGRYEDARREMEAVEQPHLRDMLTGRMRLATGDPAGALEALEAGILLWPNNVGARFLAGQAAEQLGDFDRAIAEYREALRRREAQGETDAALYLARILADKGESRAAFSALHTFLQSHPDHPDALVLMIRIADALSAPQLVGQSMTRLGQSGRGAVAIAEQVALLARHSGAQVAIDAADASALDLSDPRNALALRAVLEQHAALDQHDQARARVTAALAMHPEEGVFHELAGRVGLAAEGPGPRARAAFERSLELEPGNAGVMAGMGALLAASGAREEAIAFYDRAAESDPDTPEFAHAAIALVRAAGRAEDAEARLEALLGRHPRDARAAHTLALSLVERGALDEALVYARRAAYFETVPEAAETLARLEARMAGAVDVGRAR